MYGILAMVQKLYYFVLYWDTFSLFLLKALKYQIILPGIWWSEQWHDQPLIRLSDSKKPDKKMCRELSMSGNQIPTVLLQIGQGK